MSAADDRATRQKMTAVLKKSRAESIIFLSKPKQTNNMETKKNIYAALAAFQQEAPIIHKATEAYGYSYADLATIVEIINPILKKHGLGFTQPINGNILTTIVFHIESGETIESAIEVKQDVQLAKMNPYQVLGSAITYLRRYALSSILGLVTDKDTDAQGEQVKQPAQPATKQKLDVDSESFLMAQKAVANGSFTVAKIKSKYELTPAAEKLLTEAETGFKAQSK